MDLDRAAPVTANDRVWAHTKSLLNDCNNSLKVKLEILFLG